MNGLRGKCKAADRRDLRRESDMSDSVKSNRSYHLESFQPGLGAWERWEK